MKKIISVILLICLSFSVCPVSARDTTEISPETYGVDNLNNEKGNLYVAFLGGSITQGAGASGTITYKDDAGSGNARWSSQITKRYFQKKYPNKNVIEVNAGIGGTRSDLGLFRMKEHLIDKCGGAGPDVVFVEFAVNDMWESNANPQNVHRRMEGIVRQLAALPKQPVIIFVYTASIQTQRPELGFSNYLNSAKVHQQVADYYNIGSVNLCEYVAGGTDLEGNPIVWDYTNTDPNTWTGDGTHPNNKGYTGYADFMKKEFEERPEEYFKKLTWQTVPMSDYEFNQPQMVSPINNPDVTTTGSWNTDLNFSGWFKHGAIKSYTPSSSVTYHFTGRSIGVFSSYGSKASTATYVIDLGSANPVYGTLNTEASYDYWMDNAPMLNFDLPPGDHTIKITVNSPTNTSTKDGFVIGYFLVDPEMPDPVVSNVSVNAQDSVVYDTALKGSYSYVNGEKEEGETVLSWLVSSSKNGYYAPIEGETGLNYTPGADMVGRYIKFRVTPKDLLGNTGKTMESEPVLVSLPSVEECFSTKGIAFSNKGEAIVASSTITNNLEDCSLKVSVMMAEYEEAEDGTTKLLQRKKVTRDIAAGETVTLSAEINVSDSPDNLVKAMVWTDPGMEPITPVAQLVGGKMDKVTYIDTEEDEQDASVFVYEINWMN